MKHAGRTAHSERLRSGEPLSGKCGGWKGKKRASPEGLEGSGMWTSSGSPSHTYTSPYSSLKGPMAEEDVLMDTILWNF